MYKRQLVYSFENRFRHLSNYHARAALYEMCMTRGFTVTTTNDPKSINATRLAATDVVVFAVNSGSGIDSLGRADFEAWARAGGGVVGLEAASASEEEWPFYTESIGAIFDGHPPGLQTATVRIETPNHPIFAGLPTELEVTDQWYVFKSRPEEVPDLSITMTLDESTLPADFPEEYKRGYHAIGWTHERFGGRVFYTVLGDNPEVFVNPTLLEIIGRAIEWTSGVRN